MNQTEYLMLRLARLKPPEEVEYKGEGLTFLFCKGGFGKYTSKQSTHRISPGDILVFNGGTGGKLSVFEGKETFLYWTFSICFENLLPLFSGEEVSLLHTITDGYRAGKVYSASLPVAGECQRLLAVVPAQFNLDHRGHLIRIAATILSGEFKEGLGKRNGHFKADDHMVKVFERLSAAELINLSVGELADRFSCSRRHLNRLFHQHFGVSVASLRMEMRLLKAVSLLRDANAKVINVAEECGFNHLGLFNTCFKRRFGTSPGQWRKAALQAENTRRAKPENKMNCPLHYSGLCPLSNQSETSVGMIRDRAEETAETDNGTEALNRRDLILGNPALANPDSSLTDARGLA